jgi:hypothetical protein
MLSWFSVNHCRSGARIRPAFTGAWDIDSDSAQDTRALMLRPVVIAAGCVMALMLLPSVAVAQQIATVRGRVVDATGEPLPGASVDLQAAATLLTATTDGEGAYRLERVPVGQAELTIRLINFTTFRRDVEIGAGEEVTVDAMLSVSLHADVVVTACDRARVDFAFRPHRFNRRRKDESPEPHGGSPAIDGDIRRRAGRRSCFATR